MTSVRVSFVSFSLGLTTILAVSAVTSHKIRKCNSYQVKTQIGKFRRNILTLSETLTPMLLLTMIELIRVMIIQYSLTYEETDYQKRKAIHILLIVLDVIINDLVLGVFLPCKVISNLVRDMPERSDQSERSFYTSGAGGVVMPRREMETGRERRGVVMVNRRQFATLPPVEI